MALVLKLAVFSVQLETERARGDHKSLALRVDQFG
jgi:hypothetical protein